MPVQNCPLNKPAVDFNYSERIKSLLKNAFFYCFEDMSKKTTFCQLLNQCDMENRGHLIVVSTKEFYREVCRVSSEENYCKQFLNSTGK